MTGGTATDYSGNISMDQTRISQETNFLNDFLAPIGTSSLYQQTTPQIAAPWINPDAGMSGTQLNQAAINQNTSQMAAPWVDPDAQPQQNQQAASYPDSQQLQQNNPQMQQNEEVSYNHPDDRNTSSSWARDILLPWPNDNYQFPMPRDGR
jgi:hypothetical protein